jgi:CubicO group peptidase (beta-lactamase class C family)
MAIDRGDVEPGFGPVAEVFGDVLDALPGTGAAVACWLEGAWVVDLCGGWADNTRSRRWARDNIVHTYSVTKPFAALCALVLFDRGALDLDAPMQRYWPEFRAPATVRQVLSHQAGVVALDRPAPTDVFYDWDRMCSLLAAQAPEWEPGTAQGESALFYGHLVGELVRRVDGHGRSLGRFLRDEVCGPAGIDFAVGLTPAEQDRAVEVTGLNEEFRRANAAGRPALYRRAVDNPPGAQDAAVVNGAAWRFAEIPAVNGHGTARGVAGLYAALLEGRLLSPALMRQATSVQCSGTDRIFGHENAWGLGFALDEDGFGMGGLGGSYGGACPEGRYAFGYVTGSMGDHGPATRLENAVRACLGMAAVE